MIMIGSFAIAGVVTPTVARAQAAIHVFSFILFLLPMAPELARLSPVDGLEFVL
jgi:hypothetical protein